MSFFPPLPPPSFSTTANGGMSVTTQPPQQAYSDTMNNGSLITDNNTAISSSSSPSSPTSSIVITIILIASAIIISTTIYLLLRFLSRRSNTTHASPHNTTLQNHINRSSSSSSFLTSSNDILNVGDHTALDSLPLFSFRSVNGNLTGKDCSVCLSKFEREDQLRLLPLCCHAFHAQCIDAWLLSNQSCPLCRSTVYPTDADVMNKVMSVTQNNGTNNVNDHINNTADRNNSTSRGSSFRIEIGSTRSNGGVGRRGLPDNVDNNASINVVGPPGERLDGEVGGSGFNWLREYVERFASLPSSPRTLSFRSSGRFFRGSSRRNDVVVPVDEDLEASNNRAGQDITQLFRWLSGV